MDSFFILYSTLNKALKMLSFMSNIKNLAISEKDKDRTLSYSFKIEMCSVWFLVKS